MYDQQVIGKYVKKKKYDDSLQEKLEWSIVFILRNHWVLGKNLIVYQLREELGLVICVSHHIPKLRIWAWHLKQYKVNMKTVIFFSYIILEIYIENWKNVAIFLKNDI